MHGLDNENGPHAGDMPNFTVAGKKGKADATLVNGRVTLDGRSAFGVYERRDGADDSCAEGRHAYRPDGERRGAHCLRDDHEVSYGFGRRYKAVADAAHGY